MALVDNPTKFADKFKLKSSRLLNWDYSTPGFYFITICTYNHNNFFGKIINNKMELSKMGIITNQCLINIPKHFSNVILNEYIVMPNHVHILLNLSKPLSNSVETHHDASLSIKYNNYYYHRIAIRSSQTIPLVIKQFKSATTRQINPKTIFFSWQPRFHDHIIQNEKEYLIIKQYIKNNIKNWNKDKYYKK
ncbi:MAG: transposase [Candidatus Shapirobacteria bacterium]|nr:transposase [Candidatus Shapirobacteria bacterium]MDD4410746.1 transposase [Candidatus Shapirobacteria bacterium]